MKARCFLGGDIETRSIGVMEWWSAGFRKNALLHFSSTPSLQGARA
jgi:hypothetical protein